MKTPKTRTEKIAAALLARGEDELFNQSTKKYRVFTRKERGDFYFLGRSAALRVGKNATNSLSCSEAIKDRLIIAAGLTV